MLDSGANERKDKIHTSAFASIRATLLIEVDFKQAIYLLCLTGFSGANCCCHLLPPNARLGCQREKRKKKIHTSGYWLR
jgi:hypothetical protein